MFRVNFGSSLGAFGVPNELVDNHLKLSGVLSLKALLLLLRHGQPMSASQLAQLLGQNEGDIRDALHYWTQSGLVMEVSGQKEKEKQAAAVQSQLPATAPPPIAPEAPPPKKADKAAPVETTTAPQVKVEKFRRLNRFDVNEIARQDTTVQVLLEESQNILVRPLSNRESEMLVTFYHYYGLSADVLLMLLTYCKMINKDHAGYIEKMAADWVTREINTHERAETELVRLTKKDEQEGEIRQVFGIYDRSLTPKEKAHYATWVGEYAFDTAMIKLANERTIDSKGKLNFAYTNGILKAWHQKGIKSPSEAEQEGRGSATGRDSASSDNGNASYDLNKMDDIITHGSIWD